MANLLDFFGVYVDCQPVHSLLATQIRTDTLLLVTVNQVCDNVRKMYA